jgi:serine protease Do
VLRDGKERLVNVTLGELPTEQLAGDGERVRPGTGKPKAEGLAGIEVAEVDARTRREMGIPSDVRGAVVTGVEPDSQAYEAGLRPGYVILEINKQKTSSPRDVTEAIRKAKGGRLLMRVWSRGGGRFIVIEPEKHSEQGKE